MCATAPPVRRAVVLPAPPADPQTVAYATFAAAALAPGGPGAGVLSGAALHAFCQAKGARGPDAAAAAERYVAEERAVRRRGGALWDAWGGAQRVRALHAVCNAEGDGTYDDPDTGYTVFAAVAHLRRGHCCGIEEGTGARTHRCRHCPYAPEGALTSPAYMRLAERIPLVDAVNEAFTRQQRQQQGVVAAAANVAAVVVKDEEDCPECENGVSLCSQCKGFTFLASPTVRPCPQCDATGRHPCLVCTSWRPAQRQGFEDE
jgi:hypothetical protein